MKSAWTPDLTITDLLWRRWFSSLSKTATTTFTKYSYLQNTNRTSINVLDLYSQKFGKQGASDVNAKTA